MTYQAPPPGGPQPPYMGGPTPDHPRAQTLLITSIISLLCCAPVNIWVLITANGILNAPEGYNTSKVNTARIIAIVSLILWALGIIVNLATGTLTGLFGS
ncbi:MAG: hypothetical protein ACK5LS_12010 [Propioniciclava sp.]